MHAYVYNSQADTLEGKLDDYIANLLDMLSSGRCSIRFSLL